MMDLSEQRDHGGSQVAHELGLRQDSTTRATTDSVQTKLEDIDEETTSRHDGTLWNVVHPQIQSRLRTSVVVELGRH